MRWATTRCCYTLNKLDASSDEIHILYKPWAQALSSALATFGSLQPRALGFLNSVDPSHSVSNYYVKSDLQHLLWDRTKTRNRLRNRAKNRLCKFGVWERNLYQLCKWQARLSLLRVVNLIVNVLFMGKPLVTEACNDASDAENRDPLDLPHDKRLTSSFEFSCRLYFEVVLSITAPQDVHERLVLQVYLGSNTLEFSAIRR